MRDEKKFSKLKNMALVVTVLVAVTVLVRFPFLPDKISNRLLDNSLNYTDNITDGIKIVHSCHGQRTFLRPQFWSAVSKFVYL